eukprot:jgi/Mesvir1/14153/Mv21729-RA.1
MHPSTVDRRQCTYMPHVGSQPMPVQPVAEVVPPLLGFLDQPHEGVIVRPVEATVQAPAWQRGPQQEMVLGHPGILPDFTPQPPNGYVLSHLDFLEPYTVQPVIYNYPRPAATPAPGPGMVFPRDLFLPPTGAIQVIFPSGLRRYVGVRWAANRAVPVDRWPHPDPAHVPAPPRDPTSLVFDGQFWPKRRVYEAGASVRPHVPVQHPMLSPTYGLALVEALTPDLCASARAGQLRLLVHEGELRDLMLRVMMATFLSDFKCGYVNLGQQSLTLTQPYYLYGFWGLWPPGTWRDCLLDAGRIDRGEEDRDPARLPARP